MANTERIEEGDVVEICFLGGDLISCATVLHIPVATGDCWIVRGKDSLIHYVQMFESMTLKSKAGI